MCVCVCVCVCLNLISHTLRHGRLRSKDTPLPLPHGRADRISQLYKNTNLVTKPLNNVPLRKREAERQGEGFNLSCPSKFHIWRGQKDTDGKREWERENERGTCLLFGLWDWYVPYESTHSVLVGHSICCVQVEWQRRSLCKSYFSVRNKMCFSRVPTFMKRFI